MTHWQQIVEHISRSLNTPVQIKDTISIGGGSINSAYKLTAMNNQQYFVKLNSADLEYMFQVEFDSLNELLQASKNCAMMIPSPICFGIAGTNNSDKKSYLVLEYLSMSSGGDAKQLAQALVEIHRVTAGQYGWYQDNIIGSTPQSNQKHSEWLNFWREERMIPQLKMLYDKGYKHHLSPLSDRLLNKLDSLLGNYNPPASLLHGDLWSGNYAYNEQGRPVIFDPALYYGDRETDLAMTELFGGFSQDFYRAYNEAWPLDEGYKTRKTLYNLYHILNHANLFGTSYLKQAISMMERLC